MTDKLIRTSAELVAADIQSPNWDKYNKYQFGFRESVYDGDGEPLPIQRLGADGTPRKFDLILRGGERRIGIPLDHPARFGPIMGDAWLFEKRDAREGFNFLPVSSLAIIGWKEHQDAPLTETE